MKKEKITAPPKEQKAEKGAEQKKENRYSDRFVLGPNDWKKIN